MVSCAFGPGQWALNDQGRDVLITMGPDGHDMTAMWVGAARLLPFSMLPGRGPLVSCVFACMGIMPELSANDSS